MNNNIFNLEKELFLPVYKRIPLEISYGNGVYLYDKKGREYLDLFSGLAVNALGYAHPLIIKAVTEQIGRFGHLSNSYITDIQIEFTQLLLKYSGMSKAFLTNSGTEAVEAAIKITRKVKGPDKNIIAFTGSFHGRTYGALSLTYKPKYREGFEPFLPRVKHLEFNDAHQLENEINDTTAAVFIELLQGEGGINPASSQFIESLKSLKNKYDFILVADEIQTGTGRTGYPFAYNTFDVIPDIVVTAKAIGGGLPLGALLTSSRYNNVFTTGSHGTTFGGNPVSCAAGSAVLKEVFENGLIENVRQTGSYLLDALEKLRLDKPFQIKEVRGRGLMIGVELQFNADETVNKLREKFILINATNNNVLRILPPLILNREQADYFIRNLKEVLS